MLPAISSESRLTRLQPATTLAEIAQTLVAEPLETIADQKAFYREEIQKQRGIDRIGRIRLGLQDAVTANRPYKAFVMGHPGVGKTTELWRLIQGMNAQFRPIYLSVTDELNPGTLRFYDVLLLILIRLVHEASLPHVIGFEDHDLGVLLDRVRGQLATKWTKHLRTDAKDFGIGIDFPFLKLSGSIKQGRLRQKGEDEYEISFVSDLVELINDVLNECNRLLMKNKGQRWLIVLEDFEKIGLAPAAIRDIFIGLRPALQDLNANLLITIPLWLHYSEDASVILPATFQSHVLPDIAVYKQDHSVDTDVTDALADVVDARLDPSLLDDGVMRQCAVASGGNLRDLFTLLRDAMLSARLRGADSGAGTISRKDAHQAIVSLRNEYKQKLGITGQNKDEISLQEKLTKLVDIYERKNPTAEVPNPVLYLLLRQRCILQYNGEMWMGVHPLVVDLLIEFGKLDAGSPGGSLP